MSKIFRDRTLGSSKRHNNNTNNNNDDDDFQAPMQPVEDLKSPFGAPNLSDSELRESAYEILVGACRSTGTRPLTYIPQSEKLDRVPTMAPSPSLQRSLTSSAASRVKKALGLKTTSSSKRRVGVGDSVSQGRVKKAVTVGELMRVQMRVSEQTDSRIRRALLRVAAGQVQTNYYYYYYYFCLKK